jgi:N-acetylglucosaminyldiphosphoundecaprenol N-acetyl-beta-D-mannosaminyltransferase
MPLLIPKALRNGWRIYYLGSKPGVAERGAARLRKKYPELQIRTHHGFFADDKSSAENQAVLADISSYAPHILLVGMGMPRQELWVLDNRKEIDAAVIFLCGAHMDYVAGEKTAAPRWLAMFYLEWLYRLITEPRRLWRRYLLEPWAIFTHIIRQSVRSWSFYDSVEQRIQGNDTD